MSVKEYKRSKLLELLKDEPLTSNELAKKLNIPINQIFTYLSQFQKEGKIVKCGKKGKYNLYGAVEIKLDILDTQILKKMIPAFIKNGIEIELDNNEIERVKELYAKI